MPTETEEPKLIECNRCYAVFYRNMFMPGGVFTYGSAEIVEFCDTFADADKIAKATFESNKDNPDIHVWLVQCLKTYQEGAVAIERGFKPDGEAECHP